MKYIQNLDGKSFVEKRYHERMYIVKKLHEKVYPNEANDNYELAHYKCAMCRHCIMKDDPDDGYYMYCEVKHKNTIMLKVDKMLDCRFLNFRYSDLLPTLKKHKISLDELLREFEGT